MLVYPDINPIALEFGPFTIYWYGVMYLFGFIGAYWFCWRRRNNPTPPWTSDELINLFFYGAMGVIFGGTWGEIIFYSPEDLINAPMRLLEFWKPGRSFHGGLIGVIIAVLIYCRIHRRSFWAVMDFSAPCVPIGLITGRLGNFLNGELWGRETDVAWGMVFPHAGTLPRHPSQLYEFALEGLLLFIILALFSRKPRPTGAVSGLFLVGYGLFRCIAEIYRAPELGQDFVAFGWLTFGQLLSLPMIIMGSFIIFYAYKTSKSNKANKARTLWNNI